MVRQEKAKPTTAIVVVGLIAVTVGIAGAVLDTRDAQTDATRTANPTSPTFSVTPMPLPTTETPKPVPVRGEDGVYRIDGHLVVNKTYPLPADYAPGGLTPETQAAFDAMRADAAQAGVSLRIVSGYRSFGDQQTTYDGNVGSKGPELADRLSARPGHSEHQAGLAIDVNSLYPSFGSTPEGRWVADNAHRFGFVVRYPDGKEQVTGFTYEPWHLRYFGVELATVLHEGGLTFEEYYGLTSVYPE
ncbi:MAG: M15 family metallopeptidase [Aeromicrobium sp.]|uniref:M15 family metallopeptidase n=1 Tax=Aeromicrobium sp. TaxID=1871063 RepID=UPI0039E2EE06